MPDDRGQRRERIEVALVGDGEVRAGRASVVLDPVQLDVDKKGRHDDEETRES